MKYYIAEETVGLKAVLDREILSWEGVEERKMMGYPSYLVSRKMFALVVTKSAVITSSTKSQRRRSQASTSGSHLKPTGPSRNGPIWSWSPRMYPRLSP